MKNRGVAFCLMWLLIPAECFLFSKLFILLPITAFRIGLTLLGVSIVGITVMSLINMVNQDRRKRKNVAPIGFGLDTVDKQKRYVLGDDGEIMEVVDGEKRKHSGESSSDKG
jgi:hypothetical protein